MISSQFLEFSWHKDYNFLTNQRSPMDRDCAHTCLDVYCANHVSGFFGRNSRQTTINERLITSIPHLILTNGSLYSPPMFAQAIASEKDYLYGSFYETWYRLILTNGPIKKLSVSINKIENYIFLLHKQIKFRLRIQASTFFSPLWSLNKMLTIRSRMT